MTKALVCGDRRWENYYIIHSTLERFQKELGLDVIIHGNAVNPMRGDWRWKSADRIGGMAGQDLGMEEVKYTAEWNKYGIKAGPIRNKKMLDENPDIVIVLAFHPNIRESKGTKMTINLALDRGLRVLLFDDDGQEKEITEKIA